MPVDASVTDAESDEAVWAVVGAVGLFFSQAVAPARRANALQTKTSFSFMCSYRG